MSTRRRTLILAWGNPGRLDDGLGPAFANIASDWALPDVTIDAQYQLQVEDAAMVSQAERVVFVDSYQGILPGGFQWTPCNPSKEFEFTSHVLAPSAVMFLCQDLYGKTPAAELLLIQGDNWELSTGMSSAAQRRLDEALATLPLRLLLQPPLVH